MVGRGCELVTGARGMRGVLCQWYVFGFSQGFLKTNIIGLFKAWPQNSETYWLVAKVTICGDLEDVYIT